MDAGIGCDHVGLTVADLDGAEALYARAFAFARHLAFDLNQAAAVLHALRNDVYTTARRRRRG